MRFFQKTKDGGTESTVDAYFLIEIKNLFSVALLKFNPGSRDNFHNHAFNAYTWFLKGELYEIRPEVGLSTRYSRSIIPKRTPRDLMHKVYSVGSSWCLTLRGPWKDTWEEIDPKSGETITLTHGRKIVKGE